MLIIRRYAHLYPVVGLLSACAQTFTLVPIRNSSVYCSGELLRRVQLARVFPDSKTFVDLKIMTAQNETLADFSKLMHDTRQNPTPEQLAAFVNKHFSDAKELEPWIPPDFNPDPPILKEILDPQLRDFAKEIISKWLMLGRKVTADVLKHPNKYSFLYVPNGMIVPGGRFKEIYYWDSYWVIRGLLISDMKDTAKGMIENLLYLVDTIGYIPNGSRIYYLGRSQPPLLAAMVNSYFSVTQDLTWLEKHIDTVEKELQYWIDKKTVTVEVNGIKYQLLRYFDIESTGPRPESYFEDYTHARKLANEEMREEFYTQMRSAAESGWDFSSRWFVTASNDEIGNLTSVHITRIIPVDLNSFFTGALKLAGDFRTHLNDKRKAHKWYRLAKTWRIAIANVLWDPVDGVWYDYDVIAKVPRRHFYPSCATPLWADAVEKNDASRYAERLVNYLLSSGALKYPGGIPASKLQSGEQWDYPNVWPPTQSILIEGLELSGNEKAIQIAKEQAYLWIRANYIGYLRWKKMFEKYNAMKPGDQGGGGEYVVQDGFGWTNGVALELLQKYGKNLKLGDIPESNLPKVQQVK